MNAYDGIFLKSIPIRFSHDAVTLYGCQFSGLYLNWRLGYKMAKIGKIGQNGVVQRVTL